MWNFNLYIVENLYIVLIENNLHFYIGNSAAKR